MVLISALGLTISGHSVNGIGYGNAVVALVVGSWCFFLGRDRMAATPGVLLSFFLAVLVAAPYPVGTSTFLSSHAMAYNRYGYALLGLLLLESLEVARGINRQRDEWIGGISTGAALSLTLFLKASYFLVGAVVIAVVSLLLWRLARQRILGIVLGFFDGSLCLLAYLRFDVAAMLGELRMAAGARAGALNPKILLLNTLDQHRSLAHRRAFRFRRCAGVRRSCPPLARVEVAPHRRILFAADCGLISTNAQTDGFPLCAVFALLVANEIIWISSHCRPPNPGPAFRLTLPCYAWERCCLSRNSPKI